MSPHRTPGWIALAALVSLTGCATAQIPAPAAPGPEAALRALGGTATHAELLDGERHGRYGLQVSPDSVSWEWRGGRAAVPHCAVGALIWDGREASAERGVAVGGTLGVVGGLAMSAALAAGVTGPEGERVHPLLRVGIGVGLSALTVPLGSMTGALLGAGPGYGAGRVRRVEVRPTGPPCPEARVTATGTRY